MNFGPEEGSGAIQKILLKPKDAALALSMSERKLWSLTNDGTVESIKIGRSVFYCPTKLRAWVADEFLKGDAI